MSPIHLPSLTVSKIALSTVFCLMMHNANARNDAPPTPSNSQGSLVEMCASASKTINHDTVSLDIEYSASQRDKRKAADEVNRVLGQAVRDLKARYPQITWHNAQYQTYQERDEQGQLRNQWTTRQAYQIQTHELDVATEIMARLQSAGITVQNLNTFLSDEARRKARSEVNEMAFADVKAQIAAVAKAFGQPVGAWRVAHMDAMPNNSCNGYGRVYAAAPMMAKSDSSKAESVAEPEMVLGQEDIHLNFYIALRSK